MSTLSHFAQTSVYYETSTTNVDSGTAAAFAVFAVFYVIIIIVAYAVSSFLLSRIFKKAGVEPWKAWVPIYNSWIVYELGGQKGFWAVLQLVPIVNIVSAVFYVIAMYQIGLNLGKEGWFVLFAIFLPIVWLIWLAFDDSTWNGAGIPVAAAQTPGYQAPVAPVTPANTVEQTPPKDQTPPTTPAL